MTTLTKPVDSTVIDGKVYIDFEGLLTHLYTAVNTFTNMQHGPFKETASMQILGMVDLCKGLEQAHEILKAQHDLT